MTSQRNPRNPLNLSCASCMLYRKQRLQFKVLAHVSFITFMTEQPKKVKALLTKRAQCQNYKIGAMMTVHPRFPFNQGCKKIIPVYPEVLLK